MVDQVAIFFLAGHETSASALAWALYLLAMYPDVQDRVAAEAADVAGPDPRFSDMSRLKFTRDVFRETLRLYPPVPMMVRETTWPEHFRDRDLPKRQPDRAEPLASAPARTALGPTRTSSTRTAMRRENGKTCLREAYIPFSSGARVCTGAGFAMVEGPLLLALLVRGLPVRLHRGRRSGSGCASDGAGETGHSAACIAARIVPLQVREGAIRGLAVTAWCPG